MSDPRRERDDRLGSACAAVRISVPALRRHVRVTLTGAAGASRVARLSWESMAGAEPVAVRVAFDGLVLPVAAPRTVALPAHDPAQLHFLRAELEFDAGVVSAAELVFGGSYGDRVSTDLTAVPVRGAAGKLHRRGALAGLLVEDGEPLAIAAVDKGPAQIFVVPDRHCRAGLEELSRFRYAQQSSAFTYRARRLRRFAPLQRNQFLHILWPVTERREGVHQTFDLFPARPPAGGGHNEDARCLTRRPGNAGGRLSAVDGGGPRRIFSTRKEAG